MRFPLVRRIGEPLIGDALDRFIGAHGVIDLQRDAVVVAEIELVQVALQVLLAAMLAHDFYDP